MTSTATSGALFDLSPIVMDGSAEEVRLYLEMYDSAPLAVPVGFTARIGPGLASRAADRQVVN